MTIISELQLSKDLIRFPSITPKDAGAIKFLSKKLKKLGFNSKILEFKGKGSKPIKNLYARIGKKRPYSAREPVTTQTFLLFITNHLLDSRVLQLYQ